MQRPVAICGFKEYIFSEKAGTLANFAAATEYAFATVIQVTLRGTEEMGWGRSVSD